MITKEEYKKAKKNCSMLHTHTIKDYDLMRQYEKQEVLIKLDNTVKDYPSEIKDFISMICRKYYYEVEVTRFMLRIKCFDEFL